MTSYSTVQQQQLSQLGAYLQEKRQEQGKSIEDISLQTYIRAQLIQAVESGDTTDLPQPIFVQGFIRRYADALGLDGSNFAKQFPVHSIPNTPRPNPRPATQIDLPVAKGTPAPPTRQQVNETKAQTPPPVPAPEKPQVQPPEIPAVGALPVQPEPPAIPTVNKPTVQPPGDIAPPPQVAKPNIQPPSTPVARPPEVDTSPKFQLDPTPMDESELSALGFGNSLGDGINLPESAPGNRPSAPPPLTPASNPGGSSMNGLSGGSSESFMDWWLWGVGGAVLLGAIALITIRVTGIGSEMREEQAKVTISDTEVEEPEAPPAPEPEPAPVSAAPVSLEVEITEAGPSWMSIEVDGEIAFEGQMAPGEKKLWEGQEKITMNVGNAGAALISANGSDQTPAGAPGGAELLSFTADSE
ncbi:helix-turn-helix domain-containing protein [Leptothoe kymatousa]|uniref:DUF4115 domain-containing protein n=1 Tax=Leptothoe kymatousa TAU-MAC 1615 TaxID=2364775 RepID=A0ABS5XZ05_9CYAN|nr:helix-turn-helix domain-containing protein [Leptothoe kymatousa]MBT9310857.1 DUF4115 domain-containing protein [Leptothoe kymatousa TAU-MAC 1615]